MFETADTNNDKRVDKKELQILLDSLNKHKISNAKLDEIFTDLDADKSGGLDFDEFK
jgi:Ca2+-binding EF-hand superfamily protein